MAWNGQESRERGDRVVADPARALTELVRSGLP